MRLIRPSAVSALLVALCLAVAPARGQALDQVPADALVVLKVKKLDQVSQKIAKLAQKLGLDQDSPELKDPLGSLMQETKMSQGINRGGDLVFVFVDPATVGGAEDKAMMALVPVSDYKAFLKNFQSAKDAGPGMSEVQMKGESQPAFVSSWGTYAALSPSKEVLAKKPTGLKLTGLSAKESEKDVMVYANVKAISKLVMPQITEGKKQMLDELQQNLEKANATKFAPLAKAVAGQLVAVAEEFLNDAHSATLTLNLTDTGIGATMASDFEPTSYIGKLALQSKPAGGSMLAGLPDRKYIFFGGASSTPAVTTQLVNDVLDPIIKELKAVPETAKIAGALDSAKASYSAMTGWSMGYVAPTGGLGEESLLQQVSVIRGDAKTIKAGQKSVITAMSDFMKSAGQNAANGASADMTYQENAKTVAGVKFDHFETKLNLPDENNPEAAQAKQMLGLIYGPGGMSGVLGEVTPKTLVAVQGGSDELITDAVTSAKANTDALGAQASVRTTSSALPKDRNVEAYLDLGTLLSTGVRYARAFGLEVNAKLPTDLPPIGFSGGSDGSGVRFDMLVPTKLMEGIMSAYLQFKQGAGQPQPGGGV